MDAKDDLERWARTLQSNWETLARSRYRDYFIASHRGWDDPAIRGAQARFDADIVLHELAAGSLARMDVLELGCGAGRLAAAIAPRVRSYTGFDISPTMVADARRLQAGLRNARFFPGDGRSVPAEARDRRYALAFAQAVFMHCPKELIRVLVADVCSLLAPGGEFRFQLLADPSDLTGIAPASEAPLTVAPPRIDTGPLDERESAALREVDEMVGNIYYMGDTFRHAEVVPFLQAAVAGCRPRLLRFDPRHIYVDLQAS